MYPICLPYIKTQDRGQELRYSIRSYKNITNWNGQIYVLGDSEKWFNNINHIPMRRMYNRVYLDQVMKMRKACDLMPEKFIASMDDIYITEKTEVGIYYQGGLTEDGKGIHARTKLVTKRFLNDIGITNPYDYEVHAPMLVERDKLREVLDLIINHPMKISLQWRSLYANMHDVGGELITDAKTKTAELKEGNILSTNFYTAELQKLFPKPSKYEIM